MNNLHHSKEFELPPFELLLEKVLGEHGYSIKDLGVASVPPASDWRMGDPPFVAEEIRAQPIVELCQRAYSTLPRGLSAVVEDMLSHLSSGDEVKRGVDIRDRKRKETFSHLTYALPREVLLQCLALDSNTTTSLITEELKGNPKGGGFYAATFQLLAEGGVYTRDLTDFALGTVLASYSDPNAYSNPLESFIPEYLLEAYDLGASICKDSDIRWKVSFWGLHYLDKNPVISHRDLELLLRLEQYLLNERGSEDAIPLDTPSIAELESSLERILRRNVHKAPELFERTLQGDDEELIEGALLGLATQESYTDLSPESLSKLVDLVGIHLKSERQTTVVAAARCLAACGTAAGKYCDTIVEALPEEPTKVVYLVGRIGVCSEKIVQFLSNFWEDLSQREDQLWSRLSNLWEIAENGKSADWEGDVETINTLLFSPNGRNTLHSQEYTDLRIDSALFHSSLCRLLPQDGQLAQVLESSFNHPDGGYQLGLVAGLSEIPNFEFAQRYLRRVFHPDYFTSSFSFVAAVRSALTFGEGGRGIVREYWDNLQIQSERKTGTSATVLDHQLKLLHRYAEEIGVSPPGPL